MAEPIIYRVDRKDRIDFFSPEFQATAVANGIADPSTFFGTSIWDIFADEATAGVYHAAYEKIRRTRGRHLLAFRSDLADVRRSVQMELMWMDGDEIQHTCRTSIQEKRPPLALFDPRLARSESFVKLCSWCGLVQVFPKWVEAEEACRLLVGSTDHPIPQLTHGLCADCHQRMEAQKKLAA